MYGSIADVASAQHLGYLSDALFVVQFCHVADSAILGFLLGNTIVMTAQSSYLRQVGNGDNLSLRASHLLHDLCHLLSNLSTHTRVYLVEDDGGQFHSSTDHCFQ